MTAYHAAHARPPRRRPYLWAGLATLVVVGIGATAAYGVGEGGSPGADQVVCPSGAGALLYPDGTWSCTPLPTRGATPTGTGGPATTSPSETPPATTTSPTAPPTVTTTSTPPASASTTPGPPRTVRAYVTGYSWFDNTPPGSADISNPVLHRSAGGTGTYADPLTVAVGHSISGGRDVLDWPAGTRFYIPNLRRYFIVEDACGDGRTPQNGPCHTGYPSGASTWLDVWVGGQGGSSSAADRCMDAITKVSTAVVDPAPDYPVIAGDIYRAAGCTQQFGDSLAG